LAFLPPLVGVWPRCSLSDLAYCNGDTCIMSHKFTGSRIRRRCQLRETVSDDALVAAVSSAASLP
jgi:hypothetical protein